MNRKAVRRLFEVLLSRYGPQGWWPLASRAGRPGFDPRGYHPADHSWPRTRAQRFEVAVGAVLTQNTSWLNVEAAIQALQAKGLLVSEALLACPQARLARLIRASGYYNQKARKLRLLARFLASVAHDACQAPSREELLRLWGIGPETADSILLYAYHSPVFVVDAYTRRLAQRLEWISGRESYQEIQELFQGALPADVPLFTEYHALMVRHAKEHCRKKPLCAGCPLASRPCRVALTLSLSAGSRWIPCCGEEHRYIMAFAYDSDYRTIYHPRSQSFLRGSGRFGGYDRMCRRCSLRRSSFWFKGAVPEGAFAMRRGEASYWHGFRFRHLRQRLCAS